MPVRNFPTGPPQEAGILSVYGLASDGEEEETRALATVFSCVMWPRNLPVATSDVQNFLSCPPLIPLSGLAAQPAMSFDVGMGWGGLANLNLWRASPDSVPG